MAQGAMTPEGDRAASARVRCPACGTDQESSPAGTSAACEICGTRFGGAAFSASRATAIAEMSAALTGKESAPEFRTFAELLTAPPGAAAKDIEAIRESAKQLDSLMSLVPLWGPWRLWQSEAHTASEKMRWTALSVALTLAMLLALTLLVPGPAERAASARTRVDADFDAIAALVERYADDTGRYPDDEIWQQTIERRDRRFMDPWSRPYRYRLESEQFVLGTYGGDGEVGGSGEDGDLSHAVPLRRSLERLGSR
jgi:hypothetical protein